MRGEAPGPEASSGHLVPANTLPLVEVKKGAVETGRGRVLGPKAPSLHQVPRSALCLIWIKKRSKQ